MAGRRSARGPARAGAALLGAGAALLVSAGPAAAASPADVLTPFVDCIARNDDGTWTAVLGYSNPTKSAISVPRGVNNKITPDRWKTALPTRFEPGVRHGVFSVVVDRGAGVVWHLGDDNLKVRDSAKSCPPATEMPAEGNGTGIVVALGVAGLVGALATRRVRRRAEAPVAEEVGPHA